MGNTTEKNKGSLIKTEEPHSTVDKAQSILSRPPHREMVSREGGSATAPTLRTNYHFTSSGQGTDRSPFSKKVNLLAKAVAMLSRREYSVHELQQKLSCYTSDPEAIQHVISRLQQENWQSDARFAENFISLRQEKWGNAKLLHALNAHQLPTETLTVLVEQLKETELARALVVWEKKFKGERAQTPSEKAKQMRFLASRGFSADTIRKVLSER